MLKNTWKSIIIWSSIFSLIILTRGIYLGNVSVNIIDVLSAFFLGLIGGFFLLTTFLMLKYMLQDFLKLDGQGKILWIIGVMIIVIYVIKRTF